MTIYPLKMTFNNGQIHEEILRSSETHQIPFQKDQIDFFPITIDETTKNEVSFFHSLI